MIVWSARTTTTFEVSVAVVYVAVSVGVKVATSVWAPTASTSPAVRGVAPSAYVTVPATEPAKPAAVAFSCVPDSAVPYAIVAGSAHVTIGVSRVAEIATVSVRLATRVPSLTRTVNVSVAFAASALTAASFGV